MASTQGTLCFFTTRLIEQRTSTPCSWRRRRGGRCESHGAHPSHHLARSHPSTAAAAAARPSSASSCCRASRGGGGGRRQRVARRARRRRASGSSGRRMEPPVVLPPSIEDVPPPGLALVEALDTLLLVQVGWRRWWWVGARGGVAGTTRAHSTPPPSAVGTHPPVCPPPPPPTPQLRDGRKIMGMLRSFDQFANLVLEGEGGGHGARGWLAASRRRTCASLRSPLSPPPPRCPPHSHPPHTLPPPTHPLGARERILVGTQYADVPLGLHVVRGENVVLFGEVEAARDPPPGLQQVCRECARVRVRACLCARGWRGAGRSWHTPRPPPPASPRAPGARLPLPTTTTIHPPPLAGGRG